MKKRVLIVDDETAIVEGLTLLLDFEAIENAGASDRDGAMTIMQDMFFPVVITDLCLHSVDEGLGLIDDVLRLSPQSKVVVLSGYIDEETEEELLRRGVSAVMHKPATSEDLVAAVQELLAHIEEEAGADEDLDLERIYLTARKRLYDIPRRRFGLSHDRAEDVLQEAWLLFLQKRGVIRAAAPWLAGTVVNLSRQQIDRFVRKRESFEEHEVLDLHADGAAADLDDVLAVRQALAQIDDRGRTLCALIGIEGLSYEEVSAATGLPIGSVGPLYIRAKKKMRSVLSH
jgi:RNA polymerase sigma factor (sigma-70 family)